MAHVLSRALRRLKLVRTPKVPRLLLLPPSLLGAVLVGGMTGVPAGLPTPWGTVGRGEPPLGVCAGVDMLVDSESNDGEEKNRLRDLTQTLEQTRLV